MSELIKIPCETCGGVGWGVENGHGCGGNEVDCMTMCPIAVQVECQDCDGYGWLEVYDPDV